MDKLESARAAFLSGTANAEQLHLLEQERAGEEIQRRYVEEKRRRKEEGWFRGVRGLFGRAAGSGEMGAREEEETLKERGRRLEREGEVVEEEQRRRFRMGDATVELRSAVVEESNVPGVGLDREGRPVPLGKMERVLVEESPILDAVQAQAQKRRPGQLDELAHNLSSSGSSWLGGLFGRGSKS